MLRLGQRLALVALVPYAIAVAMVTLMPNRALVGGRANSFVPLRTISEQATDAVSVSIFVHQVLGNVALFVPLGLALGLRGLTRRRAVLLLAAVSVSIEALQVLVVPNRAGDVDDVILNVTGGIAGYIIGRLAEAAMARQRDRRQADDRTHRAAPAPRQSSA